MLSQQHRYTLNALLPQAVATLAEILNDPKASPSVRLRAALAVLKFAAAPGPDESEVEPGEMEIDAQSCTIAAVPSVATVRLPALPARNSLCPCGSGMKFKRCCSQIQQPVALCG